MGFPFQGWHAGCWQKEREGGGKVKVDSGKQRIKVSVWNTEFILRIP